MTFISIGQTARLLGVSCTSLRRWDKEGYLKAAFRTRGGHRRYRLTEIHDYAKGSDLGEKGAQTDEQRKPRAVTYARVSAVKQKDDLERQEEHLTQYVAQQGWVLVKA